MSYSRVGPFFTKDEVSRDTNAMSLANQHEKWPTISGTANNMRIARFPSQYPLGIIVTPNLPSGYVKIAFENGHRNSGFTQL